MILTIDELVNVSAAIAKEKGWDDKPTTIESDLLLLHSEISEACEDLRKHHAPNEIWFEGQKPCGVPTELADLVIRVGHLARRHGIDLTQAINIKTEYNRTRPIRHGDKAF